MFNRKPTHMFSYEVFLFDNEQDWSISYTYRQNWNNSKTKQRSKNLNDTVKIFSNSGTLTIECMCIIVAEARNIELEDVTKAFENLSVDANKIKGIYQTKNLEYNHTLVPSSFHGWFPSFNEWQRLYIKKLIINKTRIIRTKPVTNLVKPYYHTNCNQQVRAILLIA